MTWGQEPKGTAECMIPACTEMIEDRFCVCARHWRMVPPGLRRWVCREIIPGVPWKDRDDPAWKEFSRRIIREVQAREHGEPQEAGNVRQANA